MKPIRIIGIGNELAGDDAIGSLTIKALRANPPRNVELLEAGLSGLGVLDLMDRAETVVLIDAVQNGQPPGTIHRLVIPDDLGVMGKQSWGSGTTSTHALGLAETLTLGHTLDALPAATLVYGIEAGQTNLGTEISSEVRAAIKKVASAIIKEVEAVICTNSNSSPIWSGWSKRSVTRSPG